MVDQGEPRTKETVRQEARTALSELLQILGDKYRTATVVAAVHAKASRPTEKWVRKLEMDASLAAAMKDVVLGEILRNGQSWLENDLIEPFDFRPPQGDEVLCLNTVDFPVIGDWLAALPGPARWPVFVREQWIQRNLNGLFFVPQMDDGSSPVLGFTRWNETMLLKRKGIIAALSENRYVLQDTRDALYLPERLDFFVFKSIVFSINWNAFEKAINFREVSRSRAVGHWATFNQEVPIRSPEHVWAVINKSIRAQNTINKAFSQPKRIPPDLARIQNFIRDRQLTIRCEDGQLVVDHTDRVQVLHLLTILADGYVTSDLTDRHLRTFDAEDV